MTKTVSIIVRCHNLWQRWFPEHPSFDRLEERMLAGHALIERQDVAGACRIWLEGWDEVLALLQRTGITSLEQLDRQFSGGGFVLNWAEDLDQALWNAGLDDPQFPKTRIALCGEALQRFTTDDTFFTESRRHALAESYFELGEMDKADALYREWLSADPQWGCPCAALAGDDKDRSTANGRRHVIALEGHVGNLAPRQRSC